MIENYNLRYGCEFVTCVHCGYEYNTAVGDFETKDEVIKFAEYLHNDLGCEDKQLIIQITELYYAPKREITK